MGSETNKEDAGQKRAFTIIINAREKTWIKKIIKYDEVVTLAFSSISNDPNVMYTVTFKKGDNNKPEGILEKGKEVKIKDGMRFNVTQTNRS